MSFSSSLHCSNSESKAKYGDLKFKFNVFDNLIFRRNFEETSWAKMGDMVYLLQGIPAFNDLSKVPEEVEAAQISLGPLRNENKIKLKYLKYFCFLIRLQSFTTLLSVFTKYFLITISNRWWDRTHIGQKFLTMCNIKLFLSVQDVTNSNTSKTCDQMNESNEWIKCKIFQG